MKYLTLILFAAALASCTKDADEAPYAAPAPSTPSHTENTSPSPAPSGSLPIGGAIGEGQY